MKFQTLDMQLEVEVIKPDTITQVNSVIEKVVAESISQSGLDKTSAFEKANITPERFLPATQYLELLLVSIQLIFTLDPLFFPRFKSYLNYFFTSQKLKRVVHDKFNFKLIIGDKKIEVRNHSIDETMHIVMNECEIIFKPHNNEKNMK